MGVFAASGQARTFNLRAGDVGLVPFAMGHYVENVGSTPLRFLEIFKSDYFADISLNQWLALTPRELVEAHLNLDKQVMARCAKRRRRWCRPDRNAGRAGAKRATGRHCHYQTRKRAGYGLSP
jgi:oxalate decarboxylase